MPSPAVYDGPNGFDFDHPTLTLAAACQAERLRRAAAQLANWIVQHREAEKLGFPDSYSVQVVEGAALLVAVTCFHDVRFGAMAGWPESAGVASATAFKLATGLVDAFNLYMSDGASAMSARTHDLARQYATAENVRACLHIAELCPSIFDGPDGGERFEQATAAWEKVHAGRIDSTTRDSSAQNQLEAAFALISPEPDASTPSTHSNTHKATPSPESPANRAKRGGGRSRIKDGTDDRRLFEAWKMEERADLYDLAKRFHMTREQAAKIIKRLDARESRAKTHKPRQARS